MKPVSRAIVALAAAAALAAACGRARPAVEDEAYLRGLARETWDYLAAHVDPTTGFPTDTQEPGGATNTTTIGLYLAALGPAAEMGLLPRDEALARARKVLAALGRLEHRRGFLPNWISVSGDTALKPGVSSASDFNKLVCGLLVLRNSLPEVAADASALVDRIEWGWLYDTATGRLHYGFDPVSGATAGDGSWWLAADIRGAAFSLVASGAAPPEMWDRLDRPRIEADGLSFLGPGYEMGGLFMQAMDGLFLDERGTEMGRSVADLAWHQIRFARARGLRAWGWSNCNVPLGGYTEGGWLPWWIVTPHASSLVMDYYPRRAVANLKALEALGARAPLADSGAAWGFRDSVDLRTNAADRRYLALDQAMLFLGLANRLEDGIVRRRFAEDPFVRRGLAALGDRMKPDPAALAEWARRDAGEPEPLALPPPPETTVAFDLGTDTRVGIHARCLGGGARHMGIRRTPRGVEIDFDLGPDGAGEGEATLTLPPIDGRNLGRLSLVLSGRRLDGAAGPWGLRVHLRDDQGQGQFAHLAAVPARPARLDFPDYVRLGLFSRPHALREVALKFWGRPWYYASKRTEAARGRVVVERIEFVPAGS